MKKTVLLFYFSLFTFHFSFSQNPGEWMWIHGDSMPYNPGNFGTMGVPSPFNDPPALYEPCEWTDQQGNFWMYGGWDSNFNTRDELWKYDPVTNEWTWMKGPGFVNNNGNYGVRGVSSPANYPPSKGRGVVSWVDANNNLWMFGGASGNLGNVSNDLWKYDIGINEWTWMKGPSTTSVPGVYGTQGVPNTANFPDPRCESGVGWTDNSGNLWFFGGTDDNYGLYNDLWRYNISSNTWTWIKGSQFVNQAGIYGTKGVENAANTPGGRMVYCRWKDNNGFFWFFGGGDFNAADHFNDLWRYNPATNNWAWMSGSSFINSNGNYGSQCLTTTSNEPQARFENRVAWTDAAGDLWMMGGATGGGNLNEVYNDLWKYCIFTNEWTWERLDNYANPSGVWGTMNVSSPLNQPDGRGGSVSWMDKSGHLYIFGGWGKTINFYNDLWKFTIDPSCGNCGLSLPIANYTSSDTVFCDEAGKCISFFDHSANSPTSWQWLFPGAYPTTSNQQYPTNICYTNPGTYSVTLIVTNAAGTDTLTVSPMITLGNTPAAPVITRVGDTLICSHAASYQWYFNTQLIVGATDSFYVATQWGNYVVQITDSLGCSRLSDGMVVGLTPTPSTKERGVMVYPNPVDKVLLVSGTKLLNEEFSVSIFDAIGKRVFSDSRLSAQNYEMDVSWLSNGIYFLEINLKNDIMRRKFVVVHK